MGRAGDYARSQIVGKESVATGKDPQDHDCAQHFGSPLLSQQNRLVKVGPSSKGSYLDAHY
jgi:hypothetical protein